MKNILIDISGKLDNSYINAIKEIKETSENSKYNLVIDMLYLRRDDFKSILYSLKKLKEGIYCNNI